MAEVQQSTGGSAVDEAANSVAAAWRAIRKHWPILLACVLLSGGLSLVYSKSLKRIYQSVAMVELDPNVVRPLSDKVDGVMPLGTGDFLDNREYYETQYKIITSTRVLTVAARAVSLQNDFEFFGLKQAPATPYTIEQAVSVLRGAVSVEPVRNSRLVLIKVDDTNPARARRLCDAVTQAYIEQNLEKAIAATSDSVVWLAGQVDTVKKELETSENALHEFKSKNDLPSTSINDSSNMVRQEMQDLSSALTRTRTRKQELLARLAELSKVSSTDPDKLPATELLSSVFLQNLRQGFQEATRAQKMLIAEGKGDNHPQMRSVNERVEETRAALLSEVRNIQGAVERDLEAIKRQEAGEATLYDAAHKRAVNLTMKEIEYHRLDRSRDQSEKLHSMLLEHMKGADLARMMRVNNIHLIEAATQPVAPIFPKPRTNISIGLFLGLVMGLMLVWVRDSLDNTLKTPEDVERTLGITFLGLLPMSADDEPRNGKRSRLRRSPSLAAGSELIVHERPLSGAAEAARSIRTNLMFTSPDRPFRKLLVTSSAPSEGKTTVTCSIAVALAQSGQRVCIVDCDLRRPRLHRIFDRSGDAGVTNVLVGDATVEDVAKPTVVPNLWCVPSGPIPPNPADLLQSASFKAFLQDLSERFDRVILDSPPLVAVTDSAIISTLVDATVFVARAFSTTQTLAKQGLRTLADVDAQVAGAVLNAVDLTRSEYTYRHYYYYKRNGYGPTDADTSSDGKPSNEDGRSAAPN